LNRALLLQRLETVWQWGSADLRSARVADAPDRSDEPCRYRPKATEDQRGRELCAGRM